MIKEMYSVKVSFRGYTAECESRLTNIFVKMGLIVNKTGDQEYTIISKEVSTWLNLHLEVRVRVIV